MNGSNLNNTASRPLMLIITVVVPVPLMTPSLVAVNLMQLKLGFAAGTEGFCSLLVASRVLSDFAGLLLGTRNSRSRVSFSLYVREFNIYAR